MKLLKSPYLTACIAILTSLSAFFCWMILDYHYMVDYFVQENGPVENVTLVAYVVAIAAILYYGRNVLFVRTRFALSIMLAYMFMREADMHKWLNGLSILKIKFWLSGEIPLIDKFWAVVILVPVLWMLYYFLKNYARFSGCSCHFQDMRPIPEHDDRDVGMAVRYMAESTCHGSGRVS